MPLQIFINQLIQGGLAVWFGLMALAMYREHRRNAEDRVAKTLAGLFALLALLRTWGSLFVLEQLYRLPDLDAVGLGAGIGLGLGTIVVIVILMWQLLSSAIKEKVKKWLR